MLDTGCGKTTVVQLMSVLLDRELKIVNCHASTETSDLLGGLRPLRGRKVILAQMLDAAGKLLSCFDFNDRKDDIDVPHFLSNDLKESDVPNDAPNQIITFVKKAQKYLSTVQGNDDVNRSEKRRKLENGESISDDERKIDTANLHIQNIETLFKKYVSLFEWIDGPLVTSMRVGHLFLLDEMSLADDAVLERLNSVLEPSRTLVLAEKGGDLGSPSLGNESPEIKAHQDFRIFATMNPGGDFGKRELSPALRSRFTEIWVPSVTNCSDIDLVLEQSLSSKVTMQASDSSLFYVLSTIRKCMLDYVNWFNNKICSNPLSTFADFALSLRDVLAWVRFITDVYNKDHNFNLWAAYLHGASLMHLDGLGLGTGLSHEDAQSTKLQAKKILLDQIPTSDRISRELVDGFKHEKEAVESSLYEEKSFGIYPFRIPIGTESISPNSSFKMSAPTTAMNLRRVLRAMQISKPILLEGSPGVGKTRLVQSFHVLHAFLQLIILFYENITVLYQL
jgi:midasin